MYVINGNFGNETIALMQWVHEKSLKNIIVVSTDTGWASSAWSVRIKQAEQLAAQYNFQFKRLVSPVSFQQLVQERGQFPSQKFQWCASLVKGIPLLNYLDEVDPDAKAVMIYGRSRLRSAVDHDLQKHAVDEDHHGGRAIWNPLFDQDTAVFQSLVERSGLAWLTHRSLECSPCIHSNACMSDVDKKRLVALEKTVGSRMQTPYNDSLDMGCGNAWACGS